MHKFQYLFNLSITFIKKVLRTNLSSLAPYEVLHLRESNNIFTMQKSQKKKNSR